MGQERKLQPQQIYQLLPKTNCGQCGVSKCIAFAFLLIGGKKGIDDCPPIHEEQYWEQYEQLAKFFKASENLEKCQWFTLDRDKCTGCGNCVNVCKYSGEEFGQESILKILDNLLKVEESNLTRCDICKACERQCPQYALRVDRRLAPPERVR